MTINRKSLAAFVAVVEQQSFERAAKDLHITQSAVSQRIKQLECELGLTLLRRKPHISPTHSGYALLRYAKNLHQLDETLDRELAPTTHQGWRQVSIACNADSLSTWLLDALAPWCKHHRVLIELKVDDQDETHHLLHSGDVIGCISALELNAAHISSTALGALEYHCIASPEFADEYFTQGVSQASLAKAPLVRFNQKDQLQHAYMERFFNLDARQSKQHFVPSADAYIKWIKLGMGFGMAPRAQIEEQLNNGELLLVTPDLPLSVPLYWLEWGVKTQLGESLSHCLQQYTNAQKAV
ncbi:MAG: LysR family transcriptional regulator ArgP [Pseudomonadales bacterium]